MESDADKEKKWGGDGKGGKGTRGKREHQIKYARLCIFILTYLGYTGGSTVCIHAILKRLGTFIHHDHRTNILRYY